MKKEDWAGSIQTYEKLIAGYGEKEDFLRGRGYGFIQQGELDKGVADYTKALKFNPACANCYVQLAMVASKRRQFDQFKQYIDKSLEIDSTNAFAYDQRASFLLGTGKLFLAAQDYSRLIQLHPDNPHPYLMRAICMTDLGNFQAAYTDVNTSIKLKPDVEYAYYIRAKLYAHSNRFGEAIADLSRSIEGNQALAEYYVDRGFAYYSTGKFELAIADYSSAIQLSPQDYRQYINRANVYALLLDANAACTDKRKALELVPAQEAQVKAQLEAEISTQCETGSRGYYFSQLDYAFKGQSFDKAQKIIDEARQKYPESSVLYNYTGNLSIIKGDFKSALEAFERALKHLNTLDKEEDFAKQQNIALAEFPYIFEAIIRKSMSYAHTNLQDFQASVKQLDKALEVLQKAQQTARIKGMSSEVYTQKATMFLALQKVEDATKSLETSLLLNPKNANAHIGLANIYILDATATFSNIEKGQIKSSEQVDKSYSSADIDKTKVNKELLKKAIAKCEKALEINPSAGMAYFHRAEANLLLGNTGYCEDLRKATRLGVADGFKRLGVSCE